VLFDEPRDLLPVRPWSLGSPRLVRAHHIYDAAMASRAPCEIEILPEKDARCYLPLGRHLKKPMPPGPYVFAFLI
jgi:hypothetical protein